MTVNRNPGLRHRADAIQGALAARATEPESAPAAAAPEPVAATPVEKVKPIALTVRLLPDVHDKLRRIAFDRRVSIHSLLMAGVDVVLSRHGGATP